MVTLLNFLTTVMIDLISSAYKIINSIWCGHLCLLVWTIHFIFTVLISVNPQTELVSWYAKSGYLTFRVMYIHFPKCVGRYFVFFMQTPPAYIYIV